MDRHAKTLVGMLGRRFIRDHQQELTELLGLDYPCRRTIHNIKIALRNQIAHPSLRCRLGLPSNASLATVAEELEKKVRHRRELRAWNINPNGDEDDEQDKLNRAMYIAALSH